MPAPGTWSVHSDKDPRWNARGTSNFIDGIFGCEECDNHIRQCKELYGDPPEDCKCSWMKY